MSETEQEIETNLSDADLLSDALSNDAPVADEVNDEGQPRDEHGRFAAKVKDDEPEHLAESPPLQPDKSEPSEKGNDAMVPSWRLREIREAREAAQREAERERQERSRVEAELNAARFQMQQWQQRQAQPPQEIPDPLADPTGYDRHVSSMLDNKFKEMEANFSFRLAHVQHGDTFEKAYSDLLSRVQRGDIGLRDQILSSGDPGASLVSWYKREQTIARVGDDPEAYRSKVLEDALNDEAFLAKVVEKIKGKPAQGSNSRNITKLPPSLNRATGSPVSPADDEDMDDKSLLKSMLQR